MDNNNFDQSLDALLDSLYAEPVEKSEETETTNEEVIEKGDPETIKIAEKKRNSGARMEVTGDKEELADEAKKKIPKSKKDKAGDGGRPKEVADVPENDEDGSRAKGYESIQAKQSATPAISDKGTMVKSQEEDSEEEVVAKSVEVETETEDEQTYIKEEEYQEFLEFKKSQSEAKEEELKKAQEAQEGEKLQKAVAEATSGLREENAALKKSVEETNALIKSIANKPVQRKSVSNVQALEKSFENGDPEKTNEPLSKSQVLDAAEELLKAKVLTVENVIELENTGFIADPHKRMALENYCNKK